MKGVVEVELDAMDAGVVEFICDALSTRRTLRIALHGLRKCRAAGEAAHHKMRKSRELN